MMSKLLVTVIALVATLGTAGIAFATLQTTANVALHGTAGTFGPLYWSNPAVTVSAPGTPPFGMTCGASVTTTTSADDTLVETGAGMAPGASCLVAATLNNLGVFPGTLSTAAGSCTVNGIPQTPVTLSTSLYQCGDFTFDSSIPTSVIPAGGSSVEDTTLGLVSPTPGSAAGEVIVFNIVVTGTPT